MVTPSKEELNAPFDQARHSLTPGRGSPETDPAYTNRLKNPDFYGHGGGAKPLAMISSKVQWGGM